MDATELSPAERRRAKVRYSILEAAERVFAGEGEEGLSIRRLAEEIDYSPAAIYKYFGSKEELIDELKEAFFERILVRIDAVRDSNAPFHERSRSCVKTYITTALERPHHYAAAFSSTHLPAEETKSSETSVVLDWDAFCQSKKGQAFKYLVDMVIEGQQAGVFARDLDPYVAAKSVWAASHGLAQLLTHMPDFYNMLPNDQTSDVETFITFHADLIIRGLKASPTEKKGAKEF